MWRTTVLLTFLVNCETSLIGFYGDRQNAEEDGNKVENYRNKRMSHIDWIEIEDLTPKKKPKIK